MVGMSKKRKTEPSADVAVFDLVYRVRLCRDRKSRVLGSLVMAAANRTPLRRVSQGSLSALARSQSNTIEGSTGLEFLAPAMSELAEEMEMIATNLDSLNEISNSLDSFNEAFASYLYVMKMNTLCVEWPEVRGV
jgi:DASH complex subunit DAM1